MLRRDVNPVPLVAGLLLAGLALAYLVGAWTDLRLDGRWAFPLALVALGVAGLAASVRGLRNGRRDELPPDAS